MESKSSVTRLLLIPLLIYGVWTLETYLLEGSIGLFLIFQPLSLILYTVFANIIVGIAIPVICLRSAFLSGGVNMFQIGFCSPLRTVPTTALTALLGYLYLITFTPFGTHRVALFNLLALVIPVAVAEVMICWVLIGTHIQAFVRKDGTGVSIIFSVAITSILFWLSFAAHSQPLNPPGALSHLLILGVAAALFFFVVRDVYASTVFVACGTMPVMFQQADPAFSTGYLSPLFVSAALSLACLIGCHVYLFRNFRTIRIPS
jgi:hypothetical protein